MALPTFNGFSLQDSNFITERIVFKGYASREIIRGKINRREGVKLLASEYGEKEVVIEGVLIAASASDLQTKLDNMKKALTTDEGDLILETGRTFRATVEGLIVPDEHYNQSRAPYEITFVCSDPFAEGSQQSVGIPALSGIFTISGLIMISGTFKNRPILVYVPPAKIGDTFINRIDILHRETGQTVTISGFNSGAAGGLRYQDELTINLDDFTVLDGANELDVTGAFPILQPGTNLLNFTVSGRALPGGTLFIRYNPRYL